MNHKDELVIAFVARGIVQPFFVWSVKDNFVTADFILEPSQGIRHSHHRADSGIVLWRKHLSHCDELNGINGLHSDHFKCERSKKPIAKRSNNDILG